MNRLAHRLGCTEGQLWTLGLGVALAAIILVGGVPGVLRVARNVARTTTAQPAVTPRAMASATAAPAADVPAPRPVAAPVDIPIGAALRFPQVAPLPAASGASLSPPPGGLADRTDLSPTSWGWASNSPVAGVVADPTVPDGGFPVAARGGSADKVTFLRLVGDGTQLTLRLADGGALTQQSPERASIVACPIVTRIWRPIDGGAMADAPKFDCARSSPLARQSDGTWLIDVSTLDVSAGVALVPTPSPIDSFQVVFSSS